MQHGKKRKATAYLPREPKRMRGPVLLPTTHAGETAVYADGGCEHNGSRHAKAGIGVWWGQKDERNVSCGVPGKQSNNTAELHAIWAAVLLARPDEPIHVLSDSKLCVDSLTKWYKGWVKNGWKTKTGKPVENSGLIQAVLCSMGEHRAGVRISHVPAHCGIEGNEGADALASRFIKTGKAEGALDFIALWAGKTE